MLWPSVSPPATKEETRSEWGRWFWRSHDPTDRRDDFYRSPAWRAIRNAEIKANKDWYGRDTPTCERCGVTGEWRWKWKRRSFLFGWVKISVPGRSKREWHGDHIVPRSVDRSRELDPTNVQILCDSCNYAKGNRTSINWKAYRRWPLFTGYPVVWAKRWHQRTVLGWSV